jgi:hypothetical protein
MAARYYLGGGMPHNPNWWGGIGVRDITIGIVGLAVTAVATFSGHGFIGVGCVAVTGGAIWWMRSVAAVSETSRGDKASSALTRHLLAHAGMNMFDGAPGVTPLVMGDVTMYGVSPNVDDEPAQPTPGHHVGEMGMLLTKRHKHGTDSYVTTMIEVDGLSLGVAGDVVEDQRARQLRDLLNHCAKASLPLDALELRTIVRPADYSQYAAWIAARSGEIQTPAAVSLGKLPDTFASTLLYSYTNHVLLRYPLPALRAFLINRGDAATGDSLRQCALEITEQVAEKLHAFRFKPRRFTSPERYFAYCAQVLDPSFRQDRLDDWQLPSFRQADHGDAVIVNGEDGEWWHSVGWVGVNGWPTEALYAGCLHGPVVSTDGAPCRMIVTHYGLVPRKVARDTARLAAAAAVGKEHAAEGTISTGEEGVLFGAAMAVRDDINNHNLGVNVVLRVGVCAPNRNALNLCRMAITDAMEDCADEFTWADGDPVRNLMAMLPTGTGFAITKR